MNELKLDAAATALWHEDSWMAGQFRHDNRVAALNLSLVEGCPIEIVDADGIILECLDYRNQE